MSTLVAGTIGDGIDRDRASALDDAGELDSFTRWRQGSRAGRVAESSLRIGGMHCAACAGAVESALRAVPGVSAAHVSAAAQCATVTWDPAVGRVSLMVEAVEKAGYEAAPDTAVAARAMRLKESRLSLWRLFVAAFCAMQVMMLATPVYFAAPGDLVADHKRLLDWGSWLLTLPVMWFSAMPFFAGAWRAVRQRRIGMDVPVAIGMAIAFVASTGAAFDPAGPLGSDVYFDSLTMFISFLLGARYLEMRARHRAERALEGATASLPQTVLRVRDDGSVETVHARRLRPDDVVRVPRGQTFAADGVLIEGDTTVDQALLTGESGPVAKACGDRVVAGSLNLHAPVAMRVEQTGADTRFEAIVALMRAARAQRPAMLAIADRWAAPFLWTVLLLAAGAGVFWSVFDPSRAVAVIVSVLIVTCPCALSLAAPSALLAAASAMSRRGVLLQNLDAIQKLATLQTLFVDKTGTLTDGRMQCIDVERVGDGVAMTVPAITQVAASLAGWSDHPSARAVRESFPATAMTWRDVREWPGKGIEAIDADGASWRLGSGAWIAPSSDNAASTMRTWLARNGRPVAALLLAERLRDDVAAAVSDLRSEGVGVRLLSGDESGNAAQVSLRLGLESGAGAMSPEDKLAAVRAAQARGEVVGMVGDGINDAPVLARADVSFAMGEGALLARTQADGVLVANRLSDLVRARRVARRAMRVVRQNFAWAALYNLACVPLALSGHLPPWAAGIGMATSSLFVTLNSLRLVRGA